MEIFREIYQRELCFSCNFIPVTKKKKSLLRCLRNLSAEIGQESETPIHNFHFLLSSALTTYGFDVIQVSFEGQDTDMEYLSA